MQLTPEEVSTLVTQAAAGDKDAFHQLYEHYVQRIANFVFSMVRSREDTEDITQDAFVQAYHKLGSLKDPAKFEFWLYRIARNEIYQRFRRKKTDELPLENFDWQELTPVDRRPSPNPEGEYLRDELRDVVTLALNTLPPKLREVFILAIVHQKSYREIADIVGRSLLSVKTDIYRARIFAKDSIQHYLNRE